MCTGLNILYILKSVKVFLMNMLCSLRRVVSFSGAAVSYTVVAQSEEKATLPSLPHRSWAYTDWNSNWDMREEKPNEALDAVAAKSNKVSKQIILIFQVSNQFPLNNFGVDLKILGYMEKVRLTLIVQLQKFVVTMMDLELTLGLLGN